jgi:superfamily II DNA helicase RecQ
MPYRFFTIPIQDAGEAEAQLNAFLGSHRVLAVERRWVDQGSHSFWSFCVDFQPPGSKPKTEMPRFAQRERIDYKEKLPPEQFAVFAKLRDLRKEIAQAEAVPMYTVFTNEQLARMVTDQVRTKAALARIEGIGEARVAKYGPRFLELLVQLLGAKDEANGKSV